MRLRHLIFLLCFSSLTALVRASTGTSVEVDLRDQTAYLIRGGRVILATPISSGRYGHLTKTGSFRVVEKELNHFSTLYGRIVDARGRTLVPDADSDMRVPRGGKFVAAPMPYFVRFNGSIGMHAGYLPGYAASHGCVRLPKESAIAIFRAVDVGTSVTVFGHTPRGRMLQGAEMTMGRGIRPQGVPRFDERRVMSPAWWQY